MTDTKAKQVLDNPSEDNIDDRNSVPKSSAKQKWLKISSFVLVLSIIGGVSWYWLGNKNNQASVANNQPPVTGVKLMSLETANIETSTEFLGSLEAEQTVELNPELEGRIIEILVKEGQVVNQGDILFRIESQTLQAELNQAEATLKSRQAQLTELRTGSRKEDIAAAQARLKQAQIRLTNARQGSSQAEIAQAQAQLKSAQAEAKLAKQKLERYDLLLKEGAISQDQFDGFTTEAETAQAQVDVAKKRLQELKQGTSSDIAQLQAEVEEARQNLIRLQNGARSEEISQAQAQVQEATANVERIETLLDKTLIQAPITGKIGDIPIKIGDYIKTDDTLTTITENNQLQLSIAIPIEKASELKIGLPVQILGEQKEILGTGKINFIESNVTADSQLIVAKAIVENNLDRRLLNRQFVQSRIIWNTSPGILVPTSAVFRIGGQPFVFTAEANPAGEGLIAKQKAVTLGKIQSNSYQVLDGLNRGEKILSAGILQVRDGAPIQEIPETDTNNISSNN
jgi:RND family efflux transporter MFP subunit